MSSFRDQLGEDWLRYQHHLDEASTSIINATVTTPQHQTLHNGLSTSTPCPPSCPGEQPSPHSPEVPEDVPELLLACESRMETSDMNGDLETESTLQWSGQSPRHTESTLEDSAVDGQMVSHRVVSSPGPSPDSQPLARSNSRDKEEEEDEDLGGSILKNVFNAKYSLCFCFFVFCLQDYFFIQKKIKQDYSFSSSYPCFFSGPVSPPSCGHFI